MGFFKSLKGKTQVGTDDLTPNQSNSSNDQYVSGTHDELSTKEEKRRMFGNSSSLNPFSSSSSASRTSKTETESFQPPPHPPSSHTNIESFQPPSHPPPSHSQSETYSPPPGPPPSANPPPYHDWTVIPDTALLPPPPALPEAFSPANNATYESAESAHTWCTTNPPFTPSTPNPTLHSASQSGNLDLIRPSTLARTATLKKVTTGTWSVRSRRGQSDTILLSNLPLYFATLDNPLHTEREKTIYFEIKIFGISDAESGVAIGFAAQPYPAWRLPGWHRASLGVHGDDGRRFTNDSGGGRDFVKAFEVGDVVGVGMRFCAEESTTGVGGGDARRKYGLRATAGRKGRGR